MERFWSYVRRLGPDDCWEWTGGLKDKGRGQGYGVFNVASKSMGAHRFAYELAYGLIPDRMYVCHHCDNPPCVNPDHLFLGTVQDNSDDKVAKGRQSRTRGEAAGTAKLTWAQVEEIRSPAMMRLPVATVAEMYGTCSSNVSHIRTRRSWSEP